MRTSALRTPTGELMLHARLSASLLSVPTNIGESHTYIIQTIVVNDPVLHELWRHGWGHLRWGKYGKDHCSPEYNLAVRPPTQATALEHSSRLPSHDDCSDLKPGSPQERTENVPVMSSRPGQVIRSSVHSSYSFRVEVSLIRPYQ